MRLSHTIAERETRLKLSFGFICLLTVCERRTCQRRDLLVRTSQYIWHLASQFANGRSRIIERLNTVTIKTNIPLRFEISSHRVINELGGVLKKQTLFRRLTSLMDESCPNACLGISSSRPDSRFTSTTLLVSRRPGGKLMQHWLSCSRY